MTDTSLLSAHTIARFLQAHPDFFNEHADVFASLQVPHPQDTRAISLGERQILTLRERNREMEWRLSQLIHNATFSESVSLRVKAWCCHLLAENNAQAIPQIITEGLAAQFDLTGVALRLWNLAGLPATSAYSNASDDIRSFTDSLTAPYCGTDTHFEAVAWLQNRPQSLALIPLRLPTPTTTLGLLILGSEDAERFQPGLGTDFLESIAQLATAALSRLDTTVASV